MDDWIDGNKGLQYTHNIKDFKILLKQLSEQLKHQKTFKKFSIPNKNICSNAAKVKKK